MDAALRALVEASEDKDIKLAYSYFDQEDYIKSLEVIEDSISISGRENLSPLLYFVGGQIFRKLAQKTTNIDVKFTFLLGSVECFLDDSGGHGLSATQLFDMAQHLHSAVYYKHAIKVAEACSSVLASRDDLDLDEQITKRKLQNVIEVAGQRLSSFGIRLGVTVKESETELREFKDEIRSDPHTSAGSSFRSAWVGLDVEKKRNFMKISIEKLSAYFGRKHRSEGIATLKGVIDFARKEKKWKFWICRTCSKKFLYLKPFKNHLEKEHAAKLKPSTIKSMAEKVDEAWARMISVAGWEPVDSKAAAEMIKTQLECVKGFEYENGWSSEWPVAADEERINLLKEIQLLLLRLWDHKVLSCSIRDWIMQFLVKHLAQFEVSEDSITESRLVDTPQSICFLECHDLNQILVILRKIKCERNDGRDLVCRAVDSFCGRTRVKERIDFDDQFTFMFLDKRLLRSKIASFDDEGTIEVCDHNLLYAKTHPQGDHFITWLLAESFTLPRRSIRGYNLDIWVAVLRAIHYTCRTLRIKYEKKSKILDYDKALIDLKNLCIEEDERRMNTQEDQRNLYASLLCHKWEEHYARNSDTARLCAVGDVLKETSDPTFVLPDLKEYQKILDGHKTLSDDKVLKSIELLRSVINGKVVLADSKILLVENSRRNLLDDLTRLSIFDYRAYIMYPLKRFLREEFGGIAYMEAEAKAAAAAEDLLSQEKQEKAKKSGSKKKNSNKVVESLNTLCSTSVSSLLDPNVEHASLSLKVVEEDSMEPEDTVSSQRGLEISSEELHNLSGEDLMSEQLETALEEGAVKSNLALEMTLKALCNIKVLKEYLVRTLHHLPANLDEQVSSALRNFFDAFVSKQIKEDGVHTYLIGDLVDSLNAVQSMSRDAAELLVSILEFLHCWKIPESESLVTLFTLELYERMSCRKCSRKPNCPDKSSYGIVLAADSIRDLKCALGDIEFEKILKVIRMEHKMLCDTRTGGCGEEGNIVHQIMRKCPPIFAIVLEWEKNETEEEIYETTKALNWEIDISKLYEGLEEPSRKYRLVSMVGCGLEEEYICLAYKKNGWLSFRHKDLIKEDIGNWQSVVRFCGKKKFRPKILFYESSVNLELGASSLSLKVVEKESMEPEDTVSSQRGQLEISSETDKQEDAAKELNNLSGEDLMSEQLETALEEGAVRSNLALEMTLKALCNIKVLEKYMLHTANLDEQVSLALRNFFVAFVSKQIKVEGVYINLLRSLLASLDAVQSPSRDAAELLVSILEFLHCWKIPESESLVTRLFTLELYESMSCKNCRRKPNCPKKSSNGIVVDADSIRNVKCALEEIEFEKILKVIRMEKKMSCDTKTGGCGEEGNFVHHIMRKCPPIFAIVLEWKKNETEKEIYETIQALKWEIEMSRLYKGLEDQTRKYRLVSMVGCGLEEEYICLAYKKNQWFSFSKKALVKEAIGNWETVVKLCGERKIRPEILFYEDYQWSN